MARAERLVVVGVVHCRGTQRVWNHMVLHLSQGGEDPRLDEGGEEASRRAVGSEEWRGGLCGGGGGIPRIDQIKTRRMTVIIIIIFK